MTPKAIINQLEAIASAEDVVGASYELTDAWTAEKVGIEAVEPILRFMEKHPDLDYGVPGPLVHFVEKFYHKGYEDKLLESVARKPTMMTVWMLNRIINDTKKAATRQKYIEAMKRAAKNRKADKQAVESAKGFLELHGAG